MTEVKETPWADGERAELVSKLTAAIDADPASEEFKTLFLKVLEAHSEREASLLKALESASRRIDEWEGRTSSRQAALEEAAKIVRKHIDAILDKHAYRETDTNATIFTNDGAEELAASLEEIEDEIRALATTPPAEGEAERIAGHRPENS